MPPSERQRALLATTRWAWLAAFLDRWFADPLDAADGSTPDEIRGAAARAGIDRLPTGLVEWFELVGRRLEPVQDAPATPETLRSLAGAAVVWTENQGVWSILAGATDAEPGVLDDPEFGWTPAPLTDTLDAMLLSDTIVGAWSSSGRGPLGPLAEPVRAGMIAEVTETEQAALWAAYPELPLPSNPFWDDSPRGNAHAFLRGDTASGSGIEWMTATEQEFDRLAALVDLDPPEGEHEVVLAVTNLSDPQRRLVLDALGVPLTDPYREAVAGLGHLGMATGAPDAVRFHVTTRDADAAAAALLAAVPPDLVDQSVIAARPVRLARFHIVHPPGRQTPFLL